jgi:penicillin-binding protein 2
MGSQQFHAQHLRKAIGVLQILVSATMVIFLLRAFQLQVIDYDEYVPVSNQNSIRQEPITAARGTILDRNHVVMVENTPIYSLYVTPSVFKDEHARTLADLLKVPIEDVQTRLAKARAYSWQRPSRLYDEIEFDVFSRIEENIWQMPGLSHQIESKRYYPTAVNGAHLLGYLREVTEREYRTSAGYRLGDKAGRTGIENTYESQLRGAYGHELRVVNAYGQAIGPYELGRMDTEPVKGHTIYTTIDARLQELAETLMKGKTGSLVAMDPQNGDILALVSTPDFEINRLSGKLDLDYWRAINQPGIGNPLFNRAITTRQPPGSTFKPVMGLIALRLGVVTPQTQIFCNGGYYLGRLYRCTDRHGNQDLEDAITNSCNTYFYAAMHRIVNQHGLQTWHDMAKQFGLGRLNYIDLPSEDTGLLPDSLYFDRAFGVRKWGIGDMINLGIGQGAMGFSPLHMVEVASVIANGGNWVQPHVVRAIEDQNRTRTDIPTRVTRIGWIQDPDIEVVRKGMRRAVLEGSGRFYANVPGVEVAGKTGTAQNPHGFDHGWFIGFAPYDAPTIAVAVIIENGGFGSVSAAPIAGLLIEQYVTGGVARQHVVDAMLKFVPRSSEVRR